MSYEYRNRMALGLSYPLPKDIQEYTQTHACVHTQRILNKYKTL